MPESNCLGDRFWFVARLVTDMARSGHRGGTLALLLAAGVLALVVPSIPASAAGGCATPGRDGTASLGGIINTYYPGVGTAAAASTTITLGTAAGAATPIAIGDLVLVIQMQDATIDSTNSGAYGDSVAGDPATGWTALSSAGLYEYAVAASAVPLAGGALTLSSGLINTYVQAAPTPTQGQRDFQVIRVPQYASATLTAGLTSAPFNGSTGGVLVFDVATALNLNGAAVSVSQSGFRGGLGRQLAGGAGGTGTDYVNLSANPFHAQKGEGIAGTPQYVYNSLFGTTVNNGVDGYPNGSTGRGAPGTAGGGGTDPHPTANDQNTGGGGGSNGGAGGMGGNSWNSNLAMGGFGGTAFPTTATRVTAGAGGGAGTRNNSGAIANASSGGSGGGIIMIRTGSVAGAGSLTADGGTGVVPDNDGGGGGGSGGSVVVVTQAGGLAGLTINARGGPGANTWPAQGGAAGGNYHGPGGGGGGGVVLTSSAPTAVSVTGGANGTTTTDLAAFGATPGAGGTSAIISAGLIPGAGSGASCSSDLTIAKSHSDPFVRGSTGSYALTINNSGAAATGGTTTVTDTLPAGLTPTAASGSGWTCGIVAQTVTCTSTAVVASSGSFPAISITVNVAQSAAASVTNTATVAGGGEVNTSNDSASDPTNVVSSADVAVAKLASSGTVVVGSNVTYTVTATNNGPSDATGVQVTDPLPAGLTLVSATPSQGSYTSGTGIWAIGSLASGAAATLTITATVTATGTITNTASKTAQIETDPTSSNDSASAAITGQPTAVLPGPPNGGMAAVSNASRVLPPPLAGAGWGLLLAIPFAGLLGVLSLRRRSPRIAFAAGLLIVASFTTALAPALDAGLGREAKSDGHYLTAAQLADVQRYGKPISTVKPEIGVRVATLHPANGPITPYRLRIPALTVDTRIEAVGVTARRLMDVPSNIWDAAWLRSGVRPGARGQAVIDGHLDSVAGSAIFGELRRLRPGDRIFVSDVDGAELTFRVSAVRAEPLDGFPTLGVFGPAQGRFLNLITCAGHYDAARRTYDHRLVVFAEAL